MTVLTWTRFADDTPSVKGETVNGKKINGSKIVVRYPSGVEGYGEWGTTFRDNIDPNAKWVEVNVKD